MTRAASRRDRKATNALLTLQRQQGAASRGSSPLPAAGLAAAPAARGSALWAAEKICQAPLEAGGKMTAGAVKCSQYLLASGCSARRENGFEGSSSSAQRAQEHLSARKSRDKKPSGCNWAKGNQQNHRQFDVPAGLELQAEMGNLALEMRGKNKATLTPACLPLVFAHAVRARPRSQLTARGKKRDKNLLKMIISTSGCCRSSPVRG